MVDDAVVEEVLHDRRDGGEGERVAHASVPRDRYRSSEQRAGRLRSRTSPGPRAPARRRSRGRRCGRCAPARHPARASRGVAPTVPAATGPSTSRVRRPGRGPRAARGPLRPAGFGRWPRPGGRGARSAGRPARRTRPGRQARRQAHRPPPGRVRGSRADPRVRRGRRASPQRRRAAVAPCTRSTVMASGSSVARAAIDRSAAATGITRHAVTAYPSAPDGPIAPGSPAGATGPSSNRETGRGRIAGAEPWRATSRSQEPAHPAASSRYRRRRSGPSARTSGSRHP